MTGSKDFTPSPLSTLPFSSQPLMSKQENERLSTSRSEQQVENRPGHTGPLCLTYSTPEARCVLPHGQGLPDPGPNVAAQVGSRAWERGPWRTARRKALNTHLVAPPAPPLALGRAPADVPLSPTCLCPLHPLCSSPLAPPSNLVSQYGPRN